MSESVAVFMVCVGYAVVDNGVSSIDISRGCLCGDKLLLLLPGFVFLEV